MKWKSGLLSLALAPSLWAADGGTLLSQRSLLLQDSRLPREAALDRLQQIRFAFPEPRARAGQLPFWVRAYGARGDWDGDAASPRLERHGEGVFVGIDRHLEGAWVVGALAGVTQERLEAGSARLDTGSHYLGLYAATRVYYQLGFKLGALYGWHALDSRRHGAGQRLAGDGRAGSLQLFGESSYAMDFRDFTLEPFAGLAYVRLDSDGLREAGGGEALRLSGADEEGAYLTLGWRAARSWRLQQRRLVGRASLALRRNLGADGLTGTARRQDGSELRLAGREFERGSLRLDLSLDRELSPELYLGLTYAGEHAEDGRDQALAARLSLRF